MKIILLIGVFCLTGTIMADIVKDVISSLSDKKIPDKFLGKWEVDRSENFDAFLQEKGVGFFMRKIAQVASLTKVIEKSIEVPGAYYIKVLTPKKNIEYKNIQLGQEFQGEDLDDSQNKITFNYDPAKDALIEKRINIDKPEEKPTTFTHTLESNGQVLLMTMEINGVVAKRWHKKVA